MSDGRQRRSGRAEDAAASQAEQQALAASTAAAAASGYKRNVDDYDYIVPTGGRHYEVSLHFSPARQAARLPLAAMSHSKDVIHCTMLT